MTNSGAFDAKAEGDPPARVAESMTGDVGGGADMPDAGTACGDGCKARISRIARANAPPMVHRWRVRQRIKTIVG